MVEVDIPVGDDDAGVEQCELLDRSFEVQALILSASWVLQWVKYKKIGKV